ncbi:hypothetical protein GCM10017600_52880 [Streptosporangium carneum]|uniref:Uncharacterized protein n=1 Tax=Streptosporangium carneum TaxID=47481 RepID=A0A9W6I4E6_9ACTN|nr:hypothetical protein GCM10017600_52880 [Streptosporangium carneum]
MSVTTHTPATSKDWRVNDRLVSLVSRVMSPRFSQVTRVRDVDVVTRVRDVGVVMRVRDVGLRSPPRRRFLGKALFREVRLSGKTACRIAGYCSEDALARQAGSPPASEASSGAVQRCSVLFQCCFRGRSEAVVSLVRGIRVPPSGDEILRPAD